jgi:hypothetical protein
MKRAGACLVLVFSTLGFSGAALAQGSDVEGDVSRGRPGACGAR